MSFILTFWVFRSRIRTLLTSVTPPPVHAISIVGNTQGTFTEHSGTFREHSGNILGTFNIQGTKVLIPEPLCRLEIRVGTYPVPVVPVVYLYEPVLGTCTGYVL